MSQHDDPSQHDNPRPSEAREKEEARRQKVNDIWNNMSEDEKERRREEAEMDWG